MCIEREINKNMIFECKTCKKPVKKCPSKIRENNYCSRTCYSKDIGRYDFMRGKKHFRWNGGKTSTHQLGYVRIRKPEHHRAHSNGYVYEHILVMEKKIGRPLRDNEEVNHINKLTNDNREENLQLCKSHKEHIRFDKGWWKEGGEWWKKCTRCNNPKQVNTTNFKKGTSTEFMAHCRECP